MTRVCQVMRQLRRGRDDDAGLVGVPVDVLCSAREVVPSVIVARKSFDGQQEKSIARAQLTSRHSATVADHQPDCQRRKQCEALGYDVSPETRHDHSRKQTAVVLGDLATNRPEIFRSEENPVQSGCRVTDRTMGIIRAQDRLNVPSGTACRCANNRQSS